MQLLKETKQLRFTHREQQLGDLPECLPLADCLGIGYGLEVRGEALIWERARARSTGPDAQRCFPTPELAAAHYAMKEPDALGTEIRWMGRNVMEAGIGDSVEADLRTLSELNGIA